MLGVDEGALTELLRIDFTSFRNPGYWVWKYKNNPDFDMALVIIAEKEGKIVGCNHWIARELKISKNIQITAALAGDLLVRPDHRGYGIAAELLRAMRSSYAVQKKGLSLTYMFAPLKLNNRLYEPVAGYVRAPNSTLTYRKMFNCHQMAEKVSELNSRIKEKPTLKRELGKLRVTVLFKITGSPPFALLFKPDGISLNENTIEAPDIVIQGLLPLSSAIFEGKLNSKSLMWSFITGKLKIRRGITKILKLRRGVQLLHKASTT
jgi:predicted N-acetyltransferase YhbS